jgi:hypothetical protein
VYTVIRKSFSYAFLALILAGLTSDLAWAGESWASVPLAGGRSTLLPSLGLAADLPRAMVIGEIVRTVYAARDPHGRLARTLTAYFASPPAQGDERIPLPMPPEFWQRHVVARVVPDRELVGAILSDRRAALICYGLLGLDEETRAFILANPAVVADMTERDAGALASFAGIVRVRNGALNLPGGEESVGVWTALLGTSPQRTTEAIRALLTVDYGRLATFAEALEELDAEHLALVLPKSGSDASRIANARAVYRSFALVDQARNLSDLTFQRVPYGAGTFLAALPPGPDHTIEGPEGYWRALMENDLVPNRGAPEWETFDTSVTTTPAFVLDRYALESLPGRRELISTVHFLKRLSERFPDISLSDRVLLGRAFRRYTALVLSLERIGVSDLEVWRGIVRQARRLEAKAGASADIDVLCALLQAPIAMIDRAVQVRTLDSRLATALLRQLAEIDPGAPAPARAIGRFYLEALLPALQSRPLDEGAYEVTLLHALAGLSASSSAEPMPAVVRWEDFDYRVDPAAAEAVRLDEVRNRQGGNSLDTALALVRAEALLAASSTAESRRSAAALLRAAQRALEPMDEDERTIPLSVDVVKIVDQAAADAGRPGQEPRARSIADRLGRASEAVLADTLTSIVYALWIGDPDGQPFLGGNVAHRHDFGRRSATSDEREHARWMIPEETYAIGEPWHVRGSLLLLDVGLGRLALHRTTSDLPSSQPRINESDRRAFVTSLVLMPMASADQDSADRLVAWVTAGKAQAAALTTEDAQDAAGSRLALDERRAAIVRWTAINEPLELPRLFLLSELVLLGRSPSGPMPPAWGPSAAARTGCLCLAFAVPPVPHRASTLAATGTVASVIGDLQLQVLSEASRLHLPSTLIRGILSAALQDYLDNARPAYGGDWWTLGELARTLSRDRAIDYVSALTAGGPLVPAASDRTTDGHP